MPDELRFLDPYGEIARHGGEGHRLPHWEQDGRTYFITFRLADALPRQFTAKWQEEQAIWLSLHPKPWDSRIESEYLRRFPGRVDRWLDLSSGSCVLRERGCAQCVEAAMFRFHGTRYEQHAMVVMPNHVHALVSLGPGESLEKMVGLGRVYPRERSTHSNKE